MRVRADYERDIEFLDAGAGAGHVGVIAEKDQRSLFQLRVHAAGGVWTSLKPCINYCKQLQQHAYI